MKQPSPGDAASRKHVVLFLAANPGDTGRLAPQSSFVSSRERFCRATRAGRRASYAESVVIAGTVIGGRFR